MVFTLLRLIFRLLWRVELRGDVAELHKQKVLITPNHMSFLDGILLALFLPIKPVYAVYSTISESWFMRLVKPFIDYVPLDPTKPMALKQLVRLIKQTPPAAGKELAYRVVLDEIPTPRNPGENQAGLTFQMRYSVPLFVYGTGLNTDSARPALRWQQISEGGRRWLQLTNSGSGHARLSNVAIGGRKLGEGLYGYVLADSYHRWPLTSPVSGELTAEVNKSQWRSAAQQ